MKTRISKLKNSSVNRHSQNGESDNELNRFPEKKLKTCP